MQYEYPVFFSLKDEFTRHLTTYQAGWPSLNNLLSIGAEEGQREIVRLLLDNGADLKITDGSSSTPLILAAANDHKMVIKLLLEEGADLGSKDQEGQKPLSPAVINGYKTIAKLLEDETSFRSKDKLCYPLLQFELLTTEIVKQAQSKNKNYEIGKLLSSARRRFESSKTREFLVLYHAYDLAFALSQCN